MIPELQADPKLEIAHLLTMDSPSGGPVALPNRIGPQAWKALAKVKAP